MLVYDNHQITVATVYLDDILVRVERHDVRLVQHARSCVLLELQQG